MPGPQLPPRRARRVRAHLITDHSQLMYVDVYNSNLRIDSDCYVPYLTLAKPTRLPILLCKYFNLAGAPKRTVRYLWSPRSPTAERENFEDLDATDLKRAFGSGKV
jgi:hypothetical protein